MLIKSPGKVNLALDILGREEKSGYHLLETVYQELGSVFDEIEVKRREVKGVEIRCEGGAREFSSVKIRSEGGEGGFGDVMSGAGGNDGGVQGVPLDESNTMHKAVSLLAARFSVKQGVAIFLKKMIPVGGGLGGGSSNAACVIRALSRLWGLDMSAEEMRELGAKIGMDVPFFIEGGTAVGRHFGEEIEVLPGLKLESRLGEGIQQGAGMELHAAGKNRNGGNLEILVKTPAVRVNTAEAYGMLDLTRVGKKRADTAEMIRLMKASRSGLSACDLGRSQSQSLALRPDLRRVRDDNEAAILQKILQLIHNDFETVIYERYPEIAECRDGLKSEGFSNVCLCGSGSSVFGVR